MDSIRSCGQCENELCLIKRNVLKEKAVSFVRLKNEFQCKKGQSFVLEGAPVQGLFFILQGKAKITKTGVNGRDQILRLVGPGEMVGHRGYRTSESYQINAIALEDSVICSFTNETFNDFLESVPELTLDLMLFYAQELNRSETNVKKFAQMTVREKIIDSLLYAAEKFKDPQGHLLELSRKDWADLAGTNDEQVTRTLSALKKEALINTQGKRITLIQEPLLRKEVQSYES